MRTSSDITFPAAPRVVVAMALVVVVFAASALLCLAFHGVELAAAGVAIAVASYLAGHVLGRRREHREAGARLADLIDGIGPPVALVDGRGRVRFANRTAEDMLGSSAGPLVGQSLDRLDWIGPTDRNRLASMIGRASLGETVRGDASLRTSGEERIDLEFWLRPVEVAAGFSLIAVSAIDVTGRKEGEDVQIALMQELDHRMKNTLHMVQAMIRRTARSHRTVETFERALVGRIQAFARSHEILARERWLGAPLRAVVDEAIDVSLEDVDRNGRVSLDGPHVWIEPRAALTLGLVVHELAANAVLHGALSLEGGRVRVVWRIEEGETPTLALDWVETGAPAGAERGPVGFGRHFIDRAIGHELDGEVRATHGSDGISLGIRVPLSRLTRRTVHAGRLVPVGEESPA